MYLALRLVVVNYVLILPLNFVPYLLLLFKSEVRADRFITNDGIIEQNLNRAELVP